MTSKEALMEETILTPDCKVSSFKPLSSKTKAINSPYSKFMSPSNSSLAMYLPNQTMMNENP